MRETSKDVATWHYVRLLILSLVIVAAQACGPDTPPTASKGDIVPVAQPSADLKSTLQALQLTPRDPSVVTMRVESTPPDSAFSATVANPLQVPVQSRGEVMLQLDPGLSEQQLQTLLMEFNLRPVQTLPELGIVIGQMNALSAAQPTPSVADLQDLQQLELSRLVERLQQDPRVVSAAPNSVLSTFVLRTSVQPSRGVTVAAVAGEQEDWGIADARISAAWPKLSGAVTAGVIDVGFAEHADLKMQSGLQVPGRSDDHGTHVAGILCAQHNDKGVRGVLKNCTVVYSLVRALLTNNNAPEGSDVVAWSTLFSEYLGTLLDFMEKNPAVKVINLSLGYNWLPNFNKDPRNEAQIRNLVKSQGRIYASLLEYAQQRDVVLVSAAGNDSSTLNRPLEAKWASPFNFGSRLAFEVHGWSNGLIVEAHGRDGRRAPFSNVGGDISCPGVDVLSTLAMPKDSLGTLSGTSMAAPYCAGALIALRNIYPALSMRTILRCLRRSEKSSGSVPRLDLQYAIDRCSANDDSRDSMKERVVSLQRWSDFLAADAALTPATAAPSACRYGMRREFTISPMFNQGDGQPPQFADDAVRRDVEAYAASLASSGCTAPVIIAVRLSFGVEAEARLEFALGLMAAIRAAGYRGQTAILESPAFGQPTDINILPNKVVVMVGDDEMQNRLVAAGPTNQ